MFRILLALFILIPAVEVSLFIVVGGWIGGWNTFLLILLSGFIGAYLAKREGLKVLLTVRSEMNQGRIPGVAVIDGLCVLVGGIFLITPGFFTDLMGLILVLPFTRIFFRGLILLLIRKLLTRRNTTIYYRK
ncbi:MAG: hypothetical protein RLZZ267_1476 [Bacillota bacterium]|jgi:UPF0716 protein FxsA